LAPKNWAAINSIIIFSLPNKTNMSVALKSGLFFLLGLLALGTIRAQTDITGEWYSADSSRIYKVYAHGEGYEAILQSSSRPQDREAAFVLRDVTYHQRKNRYKGVILAVSDSMPAMARISFADKRRRVLKLRLRRFFIGHTTVFWYRR
jgi:hypothetical protein